MTLNVSSSAAAWARFRFSVVGPLLSAPPTRGMLRPAIEALAAKTWTQPLSGCEIQFAATTIERWYYLARNEKRDPVGVLRRAVRKDSGKVLPVGRRGRGACPSVSRTPTLELPGNPRPCPTTAQLLPCLLPAL